MRNRILVLTTAAIILIFGFSTRAQDKAATIPSALDHVTTVGPSCPPYPCADISLQDQARYLMGHWPRDFKIAVVQATEGPKCKHIANRNQCTLRVKLDELILGTQEPDDGTRRTRVGWYDSFEIYYSVFEPDSGLQSPTFVVKPGERLVAMLTPAKSPANQPVSYVSTRLDRSSDILIQSVGSAVADILTAAVHQNATAHPAPAGDDGSNRLSPNDPR
jgi:hypothetical protein